MADNVKDKFLRGVVANMPDGISIVDDEDHILNTIVGDPKTNKIKINKSLLGGSSTGGNTGVDDGGHTGGGDNPDKPDHPVDVGDDIYPGNLNKGEVTNRRKLWSGTSDLDKETTINFDQDLGTDLSNISDGMQFNISLNKTQYLAGNKVNDRTLNLSNDSDMDNRYLTDLPLPISIKTDKLLSGDTIEIPLDGKELKNSIISGVTPLDTFSTTDDISTADTPADLGDGYSAVVNTIYTNPQSTSVLVDASRITEHATRISDRLTVFKDGIEIASGLTGSKQVVIDGLASGTVYPQNGIKYTAAYRNVVGGILGKKYPISFTTKSAPAEAKNVHTVINPTVKTYSDGIIIEGGSTLSANEYLILLNSNNEIVAKSPVGYGRIELNNQKPNTSYYGYKVAYLIQTPWEDTDKIVLPKVSVKYDSSNQTLAFNETKGSISDTDGALKVEYEPVLSLINSFKIQKEVPQLQNSILFYGDSSTIDLSTVNSSFDNIGDGIEVTFSTPIYFDKTSRISANNWGLPSKVYIPKSDLLTGTNLIDIKHYIVNSSETLSMFVKTLFEIYSTDTQSWRQVGSTSSDPYRFYMSGTYLNLSISNGSISFDTDMIVYRENSTSSTITEDYVRRLGKPLSMKISMVQTVSKGASSNE